MVNNLSGLGDLLSFNESSLDILPAEIVSKIGGLVTVLKAAGIILIGYLIFLLIKGFLSFRRHKKISKIYKKVHEIDEKLDLLLSHKKSGTKKRKKKTKR